MDFQHEIDQDEMLDVRAIAAQGWLCDAQLGCRARKAARFTHGDEVTQVAKFHRKSLCRKSMAVRESATETYSRINEIPEVLRLPDRLLSVRAYDERDMWLMRRSSKAWRSTN